MLISIVFEPPVKFSPSDFGYKVVGFLILLAIYRFLAVMISPIFFRAENPASPHLFLWLMCIQ